MTFPAIEEEIFYPACKGEVEKDVLDEAYVEHDGAKALFAELIEGSPSDALYDAKTHAFICAQAALPQVISGDLGAAERNSGNAKLDPILFITAGAGN